MKVFYSGLIGVTAGLAFYGIEWTPLAYGGFFFWIALGFIASFVIFLFERVNRLSAICVAALSMWLTISITFLPFFNRDVTWGEFLTIFFFGGLMTSGSFLPAFLVG